MMDDGGWAMRIGFANSPARGVMSWQSRQGQSEPQNWVLPTPQRAVCRVGKAAKVKANRKNRFCQLPRARCDELAKPPRSKPIAKLGFANSPARGVMSWQSRLLTIPIAVSRLQRLGNFIQNSHNPSDSARSVETGHAPSLRTSHAPSLRTSRYRTGLPF
jgi:hypothetical protein